MVKLNFKYILKLPKRFRRDLPTVMKVTLHMTALY